MLGTLLRKDGLAIAGGTMLLYTSVYFFERGYCSQLNIPLDYIEITIPTIVNDVLNSIFFILIITLTSLGIMSKGKKNGFRGWHAFAPAYCWLVYTCITFFIMEHTWVNLFLSTFLGGIYFLQFMPATYIAKGNENLITLHSRTLDYAGALFLVSMTFTIYGQFYAKGSTFDIYTQNGKQYELLKVYGENIFMREIEDEKNQTKITYFNAQNMTGMTLSQEKSKK